MSLPCVVCNHHLWCPTTFFLLTVPDMNSERKDGRRPFCLPRLLLTLCWFKWITMQCMFYSNTCSCLYEWTRMKSRILQVVCVCREWDVIDLTFSWDPVARQGHNFFRFGKYLFSPFWIIPGDVRTTQSPMSSKWSTELRFETFSKTNGLFIDIRCLIFSLIALTYIW